MAARIHRVQLDRLLVHLDGDPDVLFFIASPVVIIPAQEVVVRLLVVGGLGCQRAALWLEQRYIHCSRHLFRNVHLNLEDVCEHFLIRLRPDVRLVRGSNELRTHPYAITASAGFAPPDRAFEQVIGVELFADLVGGLVGILVVHRTGARDDVES